MRAVNLIPSDQRGGGSVGAGRSGGLAYVVLGVLVAIAGMALMYGKASRSVSSDKAKAATLTAEAAQATSAAAALAPYTSFAKMHEEREKAVASLVDTRFDWAHAIHEFGRVLSNQVSITSIDGTVGSGTPTPAAAPAATSASTASSVASATPEGSVPTFQITGCGTSQHAVADTMQRLRLIDGVAEVTLQSSTKTSGGSAASSGSTGSAGGCAPSDPVFQMTVTFKPLPSASQSAAAATGSKASAVADTSTSSTEPASAAAAPSGTTTASTSGATTR